MKRINSTQMNVSSQGYAPLDELVQIESVGGRLLQQWYYVNSNLYYPDRETNALLLRPTIQLTEAGHATKYEARIISVLWYYTLGNNSEAIVTTSSPAYFKLYENGDLEVSKNVDPQIPLTLRCRVTYADPRTDENIVSEKSITLTTNQDASEVFNLHIIARDGDVFSPLNGDSPTKRFLAKAYLGDKEITNTIYQFKWYAYDENKVEVPIETLMCYKSGQNTTTLTIDADYTEQITIILRMKVNSTDTDLQPCRDSITLSWMIPKLRTDVYSEQGDTVNQHTSVNKTFKVRHITSAGEIPQNIVDKYLSVEWAKRNSAGGYTNIGSGPQVTLSPGEMRNNDKTSTLVKADTYLKGQFATVIGYDSYTLRNGQLIGVGNAKQVVSGTKNVIERM